MTSSLNFLVFLIVVLLCGVLLTHAQQQKQHKHNDDFTDFEVIRRGLVVSSARLQNAVFAAVRYRSSIAVLKFDADTGVRSGRAFVSASNLLPEFHGGIHIDETTDVTAPMLYVAVSLKGGGIARVNAHSLTNLDGPALLAAGGTEPVVDIAKFKENEDFCIDIAGYKGYLYCGLAGWFSQRSAVVRVNKETFERDAVCELGEGETAVGSFVFVAGGRIMFGVTLNALNDPKIIKIDLLQFQRVTAFPLSGVYPSDVQRKTIPNHAGIVHTIDATTDDRFVFALLRTSPGTVLRLKIDKNFNLEHEGKLLLSFQPRENDACGSAIVGNNQRLFVATCASYQHKQNNPMLVEVDVSDGNAMERVSSQAIFHHSPGAFAWTAIAARDDGAVVFALVSNLALRKFDVRSEREKLADL